jgi:hypothetical protein
MDENVLAIKLARPDDDESPMARIAPLTLDEVLGHPDDDATPRDLEAAVNREIFGHLVTP